MGEADLKFKRPQPVSRINWPGLQQAMEAEGLEAVVAASPENFFSVRHPVTPVAGGTGAGFQDRPPGMASPGPIC